MAFGLDQPTHHRDAELGETVARLVQHQHRLERLEAADDHQALGRESQAKLAILMSQWPKSVRSDPFMQPRRAFKKI